jgi:hypothetical protein
MVEGCRVPVYMDDQKAFGMQRKKNLISQKNSFFFLLSTS